MEPLEPQLLDTLARYREALDAGGSPDRDRWLREAPEALRPQLSELFERAELRSRRLAELSLDGVASGSDLPGHSTFVGPVVSQEGSAEFGFPVSEETPSRSGPIGADPGPPVIDRYIVRRLLGAGAYGQVYEAQDRITRQPVAVKVLRPRHAVEGGPGSAPASDVAALQEAWNLAELEHPNIVRVLDAGRMADGRFFITTEFIDGPTLRELADTTTLDARRCVQLVERLASALAHAHQRRIVHRDIKPENILIDRDGNPRLVDFGVALHDTNYGVSPSISGTIAYMSPEQASGNSHLIDGRSDLFSLGVVLYELLRGARPFRGANILGILDQIQRLDPPPIRQVCAVDPEIERICMTCLAKRPADRYPSAGDLAADLGRWLAGTAAVPDDPGDEPRPRHARPGSGSGRRTMALAAACLALPIGAWALIPRAPLPLDGGAAASAPQVPTDPRPERDEPGGVASESPATPAPAAPPSPEPGPGPGPGGAGEDQPALAGASPPAPGSPALAGEPLAQEAQRVLTTYCRACHHDAFKVEGLDLLDHAGVLAFRDSADEPLITPGDPDTSALVALINPTQGRMPPGKSIRPTHEEVEIIRRWIASGAPTWASIRFERPRLRLRDQLEAIRADLAGRKPAERPFRRYLSLVHQHNDPTVSDAALATTRRAASRLLNSLSWEAEVRAPEAIGPGGAILSFDLRDYGWTRQTWAELLSFDPYQLDFSTTPDLGELQAAIESLADQGLSETVWVRADWFVATASRPPLYHTILGLPATTAELEERLGVRTGEDFRSGRLRRAGMVKSGVSRQNRLLDRHASKYGAYWKSYDFAPGRERSDLLRFPLGPRGTDPTSEPAAFDFDGGEIIFHLPNGLQAYFLATAAGARLDRAPVEIVEDHLQTSGSSQIVNGLSCIHCHKEGIKPFRDDLRTRSPVEGAVRARLLDLVPPDAEMERLIALDRERFLGAVARADGPFRDAPDDATADREPIGEVTRQYQQDLDLERLLAELYLESPEPLWAAQQFNPDVRRLGLPGGPGRPMPIPRATIQDPEALTAKTAATRTSIYQTIAQSLRLGTPVEVRRNRAEP